MKTKINKLRKKLDQLEEILVYKTYKCFYNGECDFRNAMPYGCGRCSALGFKSKIYLWILKLIYQINKLEWKD